MQNETRDGVCENWCGDVQEDPYVVDTTTLAGNALFDKSKIPA